MFTSLARRLERMSAHRDWMSGENPPYESPIETELARVLGKYIEDDAALYKQVPVLTTHGEFRLDFLIENDAGLYAFEADGREFHDYSRDMFRDAIILDRTDVVAVFRISGRDVNFSLEEALFVVSRIDSRVFSPRGSTNLEVLAARRIDTESVFICSEFAGARPKESGGPSPDVGYLSKLCDNPIWRRLAAYAKLHPASKAEELVGLGDADGLKWYSD
jgi:hypothetical protein